MARFKKIIALGLAAAALTAVATPAMATQTIVITGPSGTFGDDSVTLQGLFTETFNFLTPVGYNLTNASISTSAAGGNNINFTSVLLNGTAFTLTPTGVFEFGTLSNFGLIPGANNTITVNGTNTGDTSFAGSLVFAAVPEPATWGMMLLGFGVMGVSLRRRRRSLPSLAQAV